MTKLSDAARKLGEQPAFPVSEMMPSTWPGLTKREYLIAKNVAALAAVSFSADFEIEHTDLVKAALMIADATLNALAEEQP